MNRARLAFAAAHVVMRDDYADVEHSPDAPGAPEAIAAHIDWEATFDLRRRLASHGMGIAEAMDTAQRFEIGWPAAQRLIEGCAAVAGDVGFIAGAGTDHAGTVSSEDDLVDAVVEQVELIRAARGTAIILPMPWLSINACPPDVYVDVYRRIAERAGGSLLVHWLGEMFLPALRGYFPGDSFERIMALDPDVIRGVKVSLLDPAREVAIRQALSLRGQVVLTGDDFNFGSLIVGDGRQPEAFVDLDGRAAALVEGSHALLGILDAVAAPMERAISLLEAGDAAGALAVLEPCERLGRVIFEAPTDRYKVGLAHLAFLNGWQGNAMLPNHLERMRDGDHLRRVEEAAVAAGVLSR